MESLNFKDELTPKERMSEYLKGNEVDRLPCILMLGETAAKCAGIKVKDYYLDEDSMVETEKFAVKALGAETSAAKLTLRGIAEALGSKLHYPEDSISSVKEPILKDYADFDSLKLIDPNKDGRLPFVLSVLGKLQKEVGDTVSVGTDISAPVSLASSVRGTTNLMKDFIKNKEKLHELLDFLTQCNLIFAKEVYDRYGIVCGINDPVVSENLLSPKQYSEFGDVYLRKTVEGIYKITGKKPSLHICGKTKRIWDSLGSMNIGSFSLDNCEDVGELKEAMGDKVIIMGNVHPVDAIRNGSIEDIHREVKSCIDKASDSPRGYYVASGCQIPMGTPIENIKAITEATRIYSRGAKMGVKCR